MTDQAVNVESTSIRCHKLETAPGRGGHRTKLFHAFKTSEGSPGGQVCNYLPKGRYLPRAESVYITVEEHVRRVRKVDIEDVNSGCSAGDAG